LSLLTIAHRAGNTLTAAQAAVAAQVDVLEADVHLAAGRLELRHSKSLGPLPWHWDRGPWQLTPRSAPQVELAALLDALPAARAVMLDLKGVGRVGRRTARALQADAGDRSVLVCSRWWPSVDDVAGLPAVLPVLTCRNRPELARLRRRLATTAPPYGVSLHGSLLSASVVAELRRRVEVVMTWGVNEQHVLDRVVGLGVNGIISDSLALLQEVRTQHGPALRGGPARADERDGD
jgi:glycerophosphoryl diester phosphodiesterase